jgi:succinoglycan biosynthesis protein ExoO
MPPDVSVIIAAYNVDKYIERAIHSALAQQGVAVEVVVVDDASTDGTLAAARGINDARVTCVGLPRNGGPGAARNEAIALAHAPWIAVLDGDDTFAPYRLARCLKRAKDAQADCVIDYLEARHDTNGKTYPMYQAKDFGYNQTLDLATFIRGNLSFLGGVSLGYAKPLFATSFLKRHHLCYDPDIRIGEDYMILAEALAQGACCAIEPTTGYHYTVRAGSISHYLSLADIERMQRGDQKFLSRRKLDSQAQKAQKIRTFSLREAFYFTKLVDALKRKDLYEAFKTVLLRPTAALHLWRPVLARVERLANRYDADKGTLIQ